MRLFKYTEEQLIEAVRTSPSMRQVLIKLKVAAYGGNYDVLKNAIKHFNLDTSHFTGQAHSKGKTLGPNTPTKDYLLNKCPITTHRLRLRLIEEGILKHQCSKCERTEWLEEPISLELDHIDGNNKNNNLSNLRLLCPNCHATTSNYRGKNKKSKEKRKQTNKKPNRKCKDCGTDVFRKAIRCRPCSDKQPGKTKIDWPTDEKLKELIWQIPRTTLAKRWGVSDQAISMRCNKRNIKQPPRGHWAKQHAKSD